MIKEEMFIKIEGKINIQKEKFLNENKEKGIIFIDFVDKFSEIWYKRIVEKEFRVRLMKNILELK